MFEKYCRSDPKYSNRKPDPRTGNIYSRIQFNTRSLPCFNEFHNAFYEHGIKRIPSNIGELLSARGFGAITSSLGNLRCRAFWAMDDGSKQGSGFHFNTHNFSETEIKNLIKRPSGSEFDFNCTIQSHKGYYRIYARGRSAGEFRSLVTPYFNSLMLYKLL